MPHTGSFDGIAGGPRSASSRPRRVSGVTDSRGKCGTDLQALSRFAQGLAKGRRTRDRCKAKRPRRTHKRSLSMTSLLSALLARRPRCSCPTAQQTELSSGKGREGFVRNPGALCAGEGIPVAPNTLKHEMLYSRSPKPPGHTEQPECWSRDELQSLQATTSIQTVPCVAAEEICGHPRLR